MAASNASDGQVFLLKCELCGAKFSQSGQIVGGDAMCTHKFMPITAASPPAPAPKKQKIVYPTDPERKWLLIIEQNKQENGAHYTKFEADLKTLSLNKSSAMSAIATQIAALKEALENRRDQLEQELSDAFDERQSVIENNMKQLREHSVANEEAKDSAEDLLVSDTPIDEREKAIVTSCEGIIGSTPRLNYVETELRYSFDQLTRIESKLREFGTLHSMPVGSGKRCQFASTNAATKAPSAKPKDVTLPTVQFKSTTFDEAKQRVKLTFKIKDLDAKPVDGLDKVSAFLYIHVLAKLDDEDEEDEKAGDEQPLFEDSVKFTTDCQQNGKKWEMFVDYAFAPGITVAFKMKAKFVSPDAAKFNNAEGKWSREQTYEIPAAKVKAAKAKVDEKEEAVMESAVAAAVAIPPMAYAQGMNGQNGEEEKVEKAERKKGQISVLPTFEGVKKRVVLKYNPKKDVDDYKIETLRAKVIKKFEKKGLGDTFNLATEAGQVIATDDDVVAVLDHNMVLMVTQ